MDKGEMLQFMQEWRDQINSDEKTSIKNEVKTQITPLVRKVNNLESKFKQQETKMKKMENKFDNETRKKNILIYNLPLGENESSQTLEIEVLKFLHNMGVRCTSGDIDYLTRLGKNKPGTKPVLVKFTLLKKKLEVLSKRKKLKDTDYYINEDLSVEDKKRRKELLPIIKQMRDEDKYAIIKHGEIYTKDENQKIVKVDLPKPGSSTQQITTMKSSGGTKRAFPISPTDKHVTGTEEDIYMSNYTPNPKRVAEEEKRNEESFNEDLEMTISTEIQPGEQRHSTPIHTRKT